jgi:hypothetical protein
VQFQPLLRDTMGRGAGFRVVVTKRGILKEETRDDSQTSRGILKETRGILKAAYSRHL